MNLEHIKIQCAILLKKLVLYRNIFMFTSISLGNMVNFFSSFDCEFIFFYNFENSGKE